MVNENLNTTIIILLKNNTVLNNPILFLFSLTKETLQSMKNLLRFFSDYRHNKSWCHQLVDKHQHVNLFTEYSVLYIIVIISMFIICYSSTDTLSIVIMFSFSSTVNLAITFPSLSHLIPWRSSYVTEIASASILADMIFSSGSTKSSTP